jgi:hypothetical protein
VNNWIASSIWKQRRDVFSSHSVIQTFR